MDDPIHWLAQSAWRFVTEVIALSEPYTDVTAAAPTPQLVDAVDTTPDLDPETIHAWLADHDHDELND